MAVLDSLATLASVATLFWQAGTIRETGETGESILVFENPLRKSIKKIN